MRRSLAAAALAAAALATLPAMAQTPFYDAPSGFDLGKPETGPNGEPATPAGQITLTPEEIATVRAGHYSAALLWAGSGEWYNALSAGAEDRLKELGISVVARADAQFDPAKQTSDVETALALKPSAILTLIVDPVAGAEAFRRANAAGVKLVLADNGAEGFVAGKDYVGIVTGDHIGMGRAAAGLMADALGGQGTVGFIHHDARFFVTNNRDGAFRAALEKEHPGLVIVDAKGFTAEPQTFDIASAMIQQHPEIKGIYVAWDVAAEGVVEALRAAGRTDVKIVTHDLGANNALDMAKGGSMHGTVADMPYEVGQAMATLAAYGLLGKAAPPFSTVGLVTATRANLGAAWEQSLHKPLPDTVKAALP